MDSPNRTKIPLFPDGGDELYARAQTPAAAPMTILELEVPEDSTIALEAVVCARTPATGNAQGYVRVATVKRIAAGNAVIVGAVGAVFTAEDDAGCDATIVVAAGRVGVQVTGLALTPIDWSARIRLLWAQ